MGGDDARGTEPPGPWQRFLQWRRTPWWQRSRRSRAWLIAIIVAWSVVASVLYQLVKGAFA